MLVSCGIGVVAIHEIEVEGRGTIQGEELINYFEDVKAFDA